jgi:hypothetical protein
MTLFFENPLPIWGLGAVALAIAAAVYFAKKTGGSLLGLAVAIVATAVLLFIERQVITPSEEVEQAVVDIMDAIQANDMPGVVGMIDPSAMKVRSDAETVMPQMRVNSTGNSSLRVELDESASPAKATSFFRGKIDGVHGKTGARAFYFDQVEVDWQKAGDKWLVTDYRAFFRGKPISAAEGVRAIK